MIWPVIPESKDNGNCVRHDFVWLSPSDGYIDIQAGLARRKSHAEAPTSTWCCEETRRRVFIQSMFGGACTAWRGAHWICRGNQTVAPLCQYCVHPIQNCFILHQIVCQSAIFCYLVRYQKECHCHGSELVDKRDLLLAMELSQTKSSTLSICTTLFSSGIYRTWPSRHTWNARGVTNIEKPQFSVPGLREFIHFQSGAV